MKGAWIVVLALAMPLALAMSQPPSPTPSKSAAQQQQTSGKKDSHANVSNPRLASAGTHVNEFVTNVQTQEGQGESAAKWWAIAIAGLTFLAICAQVFVYLRQSNIMERSLNTMNASADLARKEFLVTHRPKITIRSCKPNMGNMGPDHKVTCTFLYQNEGESKAYILEIGTRVFRSEKPWTSMDRAIQFGDPDKTPVVVQSGEDRTYETPVRALDVDQWGDDSWWFAGYIKYSDRAEGGTIRKMGFLRRWKALTRDWVKYPSDEHEYNY